MSRINIVCSTIAIVIAIIIFAFIYVLTHTAHENFSNSLLGIHQNAHDYLNPQTENTPLFSKDTQKKLADHYLQHYFSPWQSHDQRYFLAIKNLKSVLQDTINEYKHNPGFGINHLPNSVAWIHDIARNMDLSHFPNADQKVITIANTNMRNLPTCQPAFGDFHEAGQGYPFDHLEVTVIAANTPAILIQKTQDGAWSFIITHNTQGWVPTPSLAVVDDQFIHQWETGHYVTLIKNKMAMRDNHNKMRFIANIGKIFPRTNHNFILLAVSDANQQAVIVAAPLHTSYEKHWPLLSTPKNMAELMNAMLGVKYGWGGIIDDSDCSLMTMSIFANIGIHLPRNSTLQKNAGKIVDLHNLSNREKEKIILSQGVPFLTLLHMPGHIAIYIGKNRGRVMIFQTVWGIPTRSIFGKVGRAIIGSTVITPADLGNDCVNIPKTWLEEMDKMVLL